MPRRKKGEEPKVRATFTLAPETMELLQALSDLTEVPMSRIVERAFREYLNVEGAAVLSYNLEVLRKDVPAETRRKIEDHLRQVDESRLASGLEPFSPKQD